ncbi:Uma2 family endonuclease [Deinococcus sp. QL22]|uniref:Uma2 family endonuclease n=1 Tax=Deinococcus sp. QL22 TaxID=2939437 RepID=UPI00211517C4|nr:Uma2 family endonuclease [Deinococcus sp. QL22]
MSVFTLKAMSVDKYLRTEECTPVKREYVGGDVYPLHGVGNVQAGTSQAHAEICGNIYATLHGPTKTKGCRLYQSEMKLRIESSNTFSYPDVMAV